MVSQCISELELELRLLQFLVDCALTSTVWASFKKIYIYPLAASGLCCGTCDLCYVIQDLSFAHGLSSFGVWAQ